MGARVLLSDGSSTSARQAVSALGPLGHELEVCAPKPFSLGGLSRFVRASHRCPPVGVDPFGYLRFVLDLLARGRHDALLPVHEEAFLFSRFRERIPPGVGVALSDFASFERLQGKAAFVRLLEELGLPQPPARVAGDPEGLEEVVEGTRTFPCYAKTSYGTAGEGVWRAEDRAALRRVAATLRERGLPDETNEVVVQEEAPGELCQAQAVFSRGRLVAAHATRQRGPGAAGHNAREGVRHPEVLDHLELVGRRLSWHGPLALDYLHDGSGGPYYIEANPRLVECMNAALSGANLAEATVRLSLGEDPGDGPPRVGRPGVRSHGLLTILLAAGRRGCPRREIVRLLGRAAAKRGVFTGSTEDLTPVVRDPPSLAPLAVVTSQVLIDPRRAERISSATVSDYSLGPEAVGAVLTGG